MDLQLVNDSTLSLTGTTILEIETTLLPFRLLG
jgi:hypothetical protein